MSGYIKKKNPNRWTNIYVFNNYSAKNTVFFDDLGRMGGRQRTKGVKSSDSC